MTLKDMLSDRFGGKCSKCGYDKSKSALSIRGIKGEEILHSRVYDGHLRKITNAEMSKDLNYSLWCANCLIERQENLDVEDSRPSQYPRKTMSAGSN